MTIQERIHIMDNNTATSIAKTHLQNTNPSLWNGEGERPSDFNQSICTYPIDDYFDLDISFEKDETDGWLHLCELREKESEELCCILSGYGIDSLQNLVDTIMDICNNN